ncbi:universal stress protein [Parasphingorhabdus sp. JC815]|uniref:universal stress protein n=1 Tax=Parasphingorhabdus sp. JC815 TaxID=3232140 RepID=UPI00345A3F12
MKSVLLYVNDDPGLPARLQAALDLTRAFNGHLTCLRANPYHPQMAFDGVTGMSVVYDVAKLTREADQKLRADIENKLSDEDVSWSYSEVNNHPARGLARNSALSDLIVLSAAGDDQDNRMPIGMLGDVLFNTHVPALVQPDAVKKFDAAGVATVAWNGSFEAGNALRAAVPLLQMAATVHILTVEENKDHDLPPLAASEYLSRHGITSEVHSMTAKNSVQEVLLSTSDSLHASYMVMGAYGKSRAREFLFGGVTRSLFNECPIPLIVAH